VADFAAEAAAYVPAEAAQAVRDEAGGEATTARDARRHHHHNVLIEQPGTESDPMSDTNGTMLRIAIPSEAPGGLAAQRSGHFGRCECFTMVDVVDGKIDEVAVLTNAPHVEGGCMSPVLALAENNVNAIVVDGIGGRPLMGFNQVGIAVHAGVGADVQTTVQAFIEGGLPVVGFDNACQH
jgi:predicted Fe-Mo cluster-binding NifX family protein